MQLGHELLISHLYVLRLGRQKRKTVSCGYLGVQLPTHVETIQGVLGFNPQLGHIFISH